MLNEKEIKDGWLLVGWRFNRARGQRSDACVAESRAGLPKGFEILWDDG